MVETSVMFQFVDVNNEVYGTVYEKIETNTLLPDVSDLVKSIIRGRV